MRYLVAGRLMLARRLHGRRRFWTCATCRFDPIAAVDSLARVLRPIPQFRHSATSSRSKSSCTDAARPLALECGFQFTLLTNALRPPPYKHTASATGHAITAIAKLDLLANADTRTFRQAHKIVLSIREWLAERIRRDRTRRPCSRRLVSPARRAVTTHQQRALTATL